MHSVDHLIIGAGSAGSVLAHRLSEDPTRQVLLLEAGGRDWHPFIHMPAGIARLVSILSVNWDYYTEPEAELNGRRLWWPRGRVLGGSSSINAMCYARGQREDYDGWAALGASGWSWEEVLPFFRRAEDQARGADSFHGVGGPLTVSDLRYKNPLSQVFLDAARAAGYPDNPDFNGARQTGVGWYQVTQRQGRRCSAVDAYLHPVLGRPNLMLKTRALATRLLFDGTRVTGAEFSQRGVRHTVHAGAVTLAGGAINSPQLLLLSGIGPAADLERLGITVRIDLPGVGANLQDHLDFCTLYKALSRISYDFSLFEEALVGLRYYLTHSGPGSSNVAEAGGFVRTRLAPDERPDVQLHFVPAQLDDHGRNRMPGHGFTLHSCVLRPASRGAIRLASADPTAPPRIHANYLSAPGDAATLIEGIRVARQIFAAPPFAPHRGVEVFPGSAAQSDAELLAAIRAKAETIYHPSCTCRMGTDAGAVVDPALRVRGATGLSVVDASVMPRLVSGNTNAPTIMIAEKAAELLTR
ncbi:MAG TPA: choline dehydrogenase [Steroidobacteraceae bacterium]|nr:choline dehydrogenase [Steroidobacteraceae bacterium]